MRFIIILFLQNTYIVILTAQSSKAAMRHTEWHGWRKGRGSLLDIGSRLHCYPSSRQGDQRPVFISAASTQRRQERCQLCIGSTDLSLEITPDFWPRPLYRAKPNRQHPASAARDAPTTDGADEADRDGTALASAPPPPPPLISAAPLLRWLVTNTFDLTNKLEACQHALLNNNVDIAVITETNFSAKTVASETIFPGY